MNGGQHFCATIQMLEKDRALLDLAESASSGHRHAHLPGAAIARYVCVCVCVCVGLCLGNKKLTSGLQGMFPLDSL
jgi:hypothetical protein